MGSRVVSRRLFEQYLAVVDAYEASLSQSRLQANAAVVASFDLIEELRTCIARQNRQTALGHRLHTSSFTQLNCFWLHARITNYSKIIVRPVFIFGLIRPPDIVCRRTYILPARLSSSSSSSSSFFLFFRQLISELAERNSTIFGHMVGSKCSLKMHVRNLRYRIPLQTEGPKTTFFGRLRNSMANLTAYIFEKKHDIDSRASALQTTRGLLHRLKTTWTLVLGPQTAAAQIWGAKRC